MKNFVRPDLNWLKLSAILSSICIMLLLTTTLKAQEVVSMEKKLSSLAVEERKSANELLFGKQAVLEIKNGQVLTNIDQNEPIKSVRLSSSSDFSVLASSENDFSSVESLTLKVKGNGSVSFDDSILSKMTSLKYVYVVFDHYMSESEVLGKFSLDSSRGWVIMYSLPE